MRLISQPVPLSREYDQGCTQISLERNMQFAFIVQGLYSFKHQRVIAIKSYFPRFLALKVTTEDHFRAVNHRLDISENWIIRLSNVIVITSCKGYNHFDMRQVTSNHVFAYQVLFWVPRWWNCKIEFHAQSPSKPWTEIEMEGENT